MKLSLFACGLVIAIVASGSLAHADSGAGAAAPAAYTGPSSVPVLAVQQLLASAHDDQRARLQGRIVSHEGGKRYTFADGSGRLPVKISGKRFPAGQSVSAEQRLDLVVEVDKGFRKTEFEVKGMQLLP